MGVTLTPAASPATAVKPGPGGTLVDAQPLQPTPEFLADLFGLSEVALGHTPAYLLCCTMFDVTLQWHCLGCSKGMMWRRDRLQQ